MAGYANRHIRLDFPDLSEEGDPIFVVIRNPKTVPPGDLVRREKQNAPGVTEDMATEDALAASNEIFARLIVKWHAYDGTSTDENQPELGLPATADLVAKLPLEILTRIGEELSKANPQMPTANQEATTSSS